MNPGDKTLTFYTFQGIAVLDPVRDVRSGKCPGNYWIDLRATPEFDERLFLASQNLVQFVDEVHQLLGILLLAGRLGQFSPVGLLSSNHVHPPD